MVFTGIIQEKAKLVKVSKFEDFSQIEIEIPTYKKENLPKHLENLKPIKPGSRNL